MGKLTIDGYAKGEYAYDMLDVTITFFEKGTTTAEALNNLLAQCERFLSIITKNGIPKENIRMEEDSVQRIRSYREDTEEQYNAHRSIVIRTPYRMDVVNMFLSVIEKENFSAELNQKPFLSNEEEIKKDLVKKAISDANDKAKEYLDGLNSKVAGIESISTGSQYIRIGSEIPDAAKSKILKACAITDLIHNANLNAPIKEIHTNVEIVYLIG